MRERRYTGVENLHLEFLEKKEEIRTRLDAFRRIPRQEYFCELAYCLLTPQSSALHAEAAVAALRAAQCFDQPRRAAAVLRQKAHYIRFHNTKAKHLARAWRQFPSVTEHLAAAESGHDLREWLVKNVKGLGWKEASHFLRNIGFSGMAILDRHVLRNLKHHGVLATIPATLTSKRYLAIESRFSRFAAAIGISMDELDLLFWSRGTGRILK
jgi:N-glycosylase/DNA lyase